MIMNIVVNRGVGTLMDAGTGGAAMNKSNMADVVDVGGNILFDRSEDSANNQYQDCKRTNVICKEEEDVVVEPLRYHVLLGHHGNT